LLVYILVLFICVEIWWSNNVYIMSKPSILCSAKHSSLSYNSKLISAAHTWATA
jgi:hypothetical protein